MAFKDSDHPVLYPMAAVLAVGLAKEIRDEVARQAVDLVTKI